MISETRKCIQDECQREFIATSLDDACPYCQITRLTERNAELETECERLKSPGAMGRLLEECEREQQRADQLQANIDRAMKVPDEIMGLYPTDVWPELPKWMKEHVQEWLKEASDQYDMDVSGRLHASWARHLAVKVFKHELQQALNAPETA